MGVALGAEVARGRPKIACIATVVHKFAHAQHFIDRFLEGYGWNGTHHRPPMDLVSLYVDQTPQGDLSRDRARRFPTFKIYPTVAEALTEPRGGSDFFGTTTTARREGDTYVLNGQKRFIVGAEGAAPKADATTETNNRPSAARRSIRRGRARRITAASAVGSRACQSSVSVVLRNVWRPSGGVKAQCQEGDLPHRSLCKLTITSHRVSRVNADIKQCRRRMCLLCLMM